MLPRSLMRRRRKLRIPAPTAPAARNHNPFIPVRKVVDYLARVLVINDCPHRHLPDNPFAIAPRFFVALAMPPTPRLIFRIQPEMHQRIVLPARFHPDIAALAAAATRTPPARHVLPPPDRHPAVPPLA